MRKWLQSQVRRIVTTGTGGEQETLFRALVDQLKSSQGDLALKQSINALLEFMRAQETPKQTERARRRLATEASPEVGVFLTSACVYLIENLIAHEPEIDERTGRTKIEMKDAVTLMRTMTSDLIVNLLTCLTFVVISEDQATTMQRAHKAVPVIVLIKVIDCLTTDEAYGTLRDRGGENCTALKDSLTLVGNSLSHFLQLRRNCSSLLRLLDSPDAQVRNGTCRNKIFENKNIYTHTCIPFQSTKRALLSFLSSLSLFSLAPQLTSTSLNSTSLNSTHSSKLGLDLLMCLGLQLNQNSASTEPCFNKNRQETALNVLIAMFLGIAKRSQLEETKEAAAHGKIELLLAEVKQNNHLVHMVASMIAVSSPYFSSSFFVPFDSKMSRWCKVIHKANSVPST